MNVHKVDITSIIKGLKENELRVNIVIPTLSALGIYKIEDWHGASEQGKDLYFSYQDPFGDLKHCVCFIKAGDIKKSGKTDIRNMEGQLKEAIVTTFINPIDNKTEVKAEELYILCNGQISKEAKEYIHQMVYAHSMPNIRIIDIDKLIRIITKKVIGQYNASSENQYIFNLASYKNICSTIAENINNG